MAARVPTIEKLPGPAHVSTGLARCSSLRLGHGNAQAKTLGHSASKFPVAPGEVPHHALLDMLFALAQHTNEVQDQVVALPLFDGAITLACLLVIVGATDLEAANR